MSNRTVRKEKKHPCHHYYYPIQSSNSVPCPCYLYNVNPITGKTAFYIELGPSCCRIQKRWLQMSFAFKHNHIEDKTTNPIGRHFGDDIFKWMSLAESFIFWFQLPWLWLFMIFCLLWPYNLRKKETVITPITLIRGFSIYQSDSPWEPA